MTSWEMLGSAGEDMVSVGLALRIYVVRPVLGVLLAISRLEKERQKCPNLCARFVAKIGLVARYLPYPGVFIWLNVIYMIICIKK